MADNFPQFQDAHPVVGDARMSDGAGGAEAWAKTLEGIAGGISNMVNEENKDRSRTQYLHTVAQMQAVHNAAEISMIEDPSSTMAAMSTANKSLGALADGAVVNKADRESLNNYASQMSSAVALIGTKTNVRQSLREAAYQYFSSVPEWLQTSHTLMRTDPEGAQKYHDYLVEHSHAMVSIGAITPQQAQATLGTLSKQADLLNNYYQHVNSGNATAKDHHVLGAHVLGGGIDYANAPVNGDYGMRAGMAQEDQTRNGILTNIAKGGFPSAEGYANLASHPAAIQEVDDAINGRSIADGMVSSGASMDSIKARARELQTSAKLGKEPTRDKFERISLEKWVNYSVTHPYDVVVSTGKGPAINQDYHDQIGIVEAERQMELSAIDPSKQPQEWQAVHAKYDAKASELFEGRTSALHTDAVVRGMPNTNVISSAETEAVKAALHPNGDTRGVLQVLSQYKTPNMRALVAQSLPHPDQQMAVMTVAMLPSSVPDNVKLDFLNAQKYSESVDIYGNQTGKAEKPSFAGELEFNVRNKLQGEIASSLTNQFKLYTSTYEIGSAGQAMTNSVDAATNYATYLSVQAGDPTMTKRGYKYYAAQGAAVIQAGFNPKTGRDWVYNANANPVPGMTDGSMDIVSNYLKRKNIDQLKKDGFEVHATAAVNNSIPFFVSVAPDGVAHVMDSNKHSYYQLPLNQQLIDTATDWFEKEQQKAFHPEQDLFTNAPIGVGGLLGGNMFYSRQ